MNNINELVLNHRIILKLIEMNLATKSEIHRLIVEEILEEETQERANIRRWFGNKLRAIEGPKEKLEKAEELLGVMEGAIKDEESLLGFMSQNFPRTDVSDAATQKLWQEAISGYLKSLVAGTTKYSLNTLRAEAVKAAIDSAEDVKEIVAITSQAAADEGGTEEDVKNVLSVVSTSDEEYAITRKNDFVDAVSKLTQQITGKPQEPAKAKAEPSKDPNLFDLDIEQFQELEAAYKKFRDEFYEKDTLAQQGEIVKQFRQILKVLTAAEEAEAAFARTGGELKEQEDDEQVRLKALPNFKSDVRIFYSNARRAKKALKVFSDAAKGGKKVSGIYKKRLIRLIEQLQNSTGRLAIDIDKLIGKSQESINEMMSAEERFDKAQQVEKIHTEIVTSFDDLMMMFKTQAEKDAAEANEPEPVNEKLTNLSKPAVDGEIKKISGLLDQIVGFFPNVKPFAGKVDFDDLNARYLEALEDLDFSVSNLRTLNQDSVAEGTLIDLRERLKLFSERLEEIFGIKAEVPGASPTKPTETEPLEKDPESPPEIKRGLAPDVKPPSEEEPEEEVAQLEDGTFAPKNLSQLSNWFTTKLFRSELVKDLIERLGLSGQDLEKLAKLISYILLYKQRLEQELEEDNREVILSRTMGIPKDKIPNFFTDLKRREPELLDFFTEKAKGKKEEYTRFFQLFRNTQKFLKDNPVDISAIDIGALKRAQLVDKGEPEADTEIEDIDLKNFKELWTNNPEIVNHIKTGAPDGQAYAWAPEKYFSDFDFSSFDAFVESVMKAEPEQAQEILNVFFDQLENPGDELKQDMYDAGSDKTKLDTKIKGGEEEPDADTEIEDEVRKAEEENPDASNEEIISAVIDKMNPEDEKVQAVMQDIEDFLAQGDEEEPDAEDVKQQMSDYLKDKKERYDKFVSLLNTLKKKPTNEPTLQEQLKPDRLLFYLKDFEKKIISYGKSYREAKKNNRPKAIQQEKTSLINALTIYIKYFKELEDRVNYTPTMSPGGTQIMEEKLLMSLIPLIKKELRNKNG